MRDLHTHTKYSDGATSPEEMVLAAIDMGLEEIGISDHSYTFFDESYCIKKEKIEEYKREISELKEKYKDKISVLCGVEQDAYSTEPTTGYDYAIGSAHYLKVGETYYPLDLSDLRFRIACRDGFGEDYYALAEAYFDLVSQFAEREDISIIGHFDLITKYNRLGNIFDEENPRYLAAAKKAIDKLLAAGKVFEFNTGAIARKYRTVPYPAPTLLSYILEKGGKLMLASDAHHPRNIAFAFEIYADKIGR